MTDKYIDLFDMMEQDPEAEDYYVNLPDYIKDMIDDRADNVRTFEELRNYADNLLSGDK